MEGKNQSSLKKIIADGEITAVEKNYTITYGTIFEAALVGRTSEYEVVNTPGSFKYAGPRKKIDPLNNKEIEFFKRKLRVTSSDYDQMLGDINALQNHRFAGEMINQAHKQSGWSVPLQGDLFGHLCKGELDGLIRLESGLIGNHPPKWTIFDIKSSDPVKLGLENHFKKMGWFFQAEFYRMLAHQELSEWPDYYIIHSQRGMGHNGITVARIEPSQVVRDQIRDGLKKWAEIEETGVSMKLEKIEVFEYR